VLPDRCDWYDYSVAGNIHFDMSLVSDTCALAAGAGSYSMVEWLSGEPDAERNLVASNVPEAQRTASVNCALGGHVFG
jgi:hypothetical protein